jgi:hypothetical protein
MQALDLETGKQATIAKNDRLLMTSLSKFYREPGNMQALLPIINGHSKVSLRLIDYFITNYVRKHNTIIPHEDPVTGTVTQFNVHLSYRAQLKAYSKQAFDCFRRRDRVLFCYDKGKSIETTIGQLNVFRWLISNNVIEYITDHLEEIDADMMCSQKQTVCKRTDVIQEEISVMTMDPDPDPDPASDSIGEIIATPSSSGLIKRYSGKTYVSFM